MNHSTCHHQNLPGIENQTAEHGKFSFAAAVLNWVSNLLRRRKLMSLERLDDHMLDDIGITRTDVYWARQLPLNQNPLLALDTLARNRSRARRLAPGRPLPGVRRL